MPSEGHPGEEGQREGAVLLPSPISMYQCRARLQQGPGGDLQDQGAARCSTFAVWSTRNLIEMPLPPGHGPFEGFLGSGRETQSAVLSDPMKG